MADREKFSLYSQPKGLYLLCATEVWERFGFYTVQAILILYLTKGLGYPDHKANMIYAAYSALLYLTPMVGGYLADRFLGFQRAILIGGFFSVLGYLVAAFPNEKLFFLGLSILICANGLFKPNVSSIVGDLYERGDPRRDGGFTLFYMGINIGALVPPLIAGVLVIHYGWHSGFLLAALGMAIGFVIFLFGRKRLTLAGEVPDSSPVRATGWRRWQFELLFYGGFILVAAFCFYAFHYARFITSIVELGGLLMAIVVLGFILREPIKDRKKIIASLILTAISVGFWALYNQTFTSLTLFADRNMEHHFFGMAVNAATMQFFNPLYIIILSPFISGLWTGLSRYGLNPSIPMKFALGVVFICLGFLVLPIGTHWFSDQGRIASQWLAFSYFLQTIGELLLSPVGLSMITELIPKHLVGMMMGVWFFAQAVSFALGGTLANWAAIPESVSGLASLSLYEHAFILFGILSGVLAIVSFLFIPFLKRLIGRIAV